MSILQLSDAVRAAEHDYTVKLTRKEVDETINRNKLRDLKARIPSPLLDEDTSIQEYAAVVASLPSPAPRHAWQDYALWWFAKDGARRAKSSMEQARETLQGWRDKRDEAAEQLQRIGEYIGSLGRERNVQRESSLSEESRESQEGRRAAAEGRETGIMAALRRLETILGVGR